MMTRRKYKLWQLALAVFAVSATGCGNFSNEDIVFMAAMPRPADVDLRVPGQPENQTEHGLSSQTQDLVACSEDNLLCLAGQVSTSINTGVYDLLGLVDNIVKNHAPTRRAKGLRLWGPVYIAQANLSVRFEMRRYTYESSEVFEYCLHAMRDRVDQQAAEDVTCDSADDDSGLTRILYGSFSPGELDGTAASGAGSLVFDLNACRIANVCKPTDQGKLTINYDNTQDQESIAVHIRDIEPVASSAALLPPDADYCFRRLADGSGYFKFSVNADFVPGLFYDPEHLEISAQWNDLEAGRADATISAGDLGSDQVNAAYCWDAQLQASYYHDSADQHPTTGAVGQCVYGQPLSLTCDL